MRITKKFNGDASIGKQTFVRARYDGSQPLEQWKADAIARYPDLAPVDPLLVKAREIAVSGGWMDRPDVGITAATITNGDFDSHPIMQAIYATLQEA